MCCAVSFAAPFATATSSAPTNPSSINWSATLAAQMGDAYPELVKQQAQVEKALLAEEEQFARTLDNGMQILEEALAGLKGTEIPGDVVFKLYDTYGFPTDLTNDIARERNLTLDIAGYDAAMAEQRRARRRAAVSRWTTTMS